jgi:hypothetical protein
MEQAEANVPKIADHFTILLYSFQHSFSGAERERGFRALGDRWKHWWSRLDDRALETALDDIYFFLPHVHSVLFPEVRLNPGGNPEGRVASSRLISSQALVDLATQISPQALLRLTYDPKRLASVRHFQLSFVLRGDDGAVMEQFSAPFEIEWVDAILFPQRVGLLTIKVRLHGADISVSRINDFHYYLRPVNPPRLGWQLADWETPPGMPTVSCKTRDVIDYLLQGLSGEKDPKSPSLETALGEYQHAGEFARPSATAFGNVYGQSFHLYHYSCLFGSEPPDWPSGQFDSPSERALFELATCTDTRLPEYRPDVSYLRDLMGRHRIALWDNWKGLALHDNVVFLGLREDRFTDRALPHNVENDYFYLYILTMFHKNRLSLLAGEMMGCEGRLDDRVLRARRLWDDFRSFQDDFWLGEVTNKPQGLEIHRRFQEGLGIGRVFEEIRAKIREYQEYYEFKLERQVSDLLAILTIFWVPTGALCSLFGSALGFEASWTQFFVSLICGWVVVWLLWLIWSRRDELRDKYRERFGDNQDPPSR